MTTTRKILIGIGLVGAFALTFAGWQGVRAYVAWNSIERVEFDLESAREALPPPIVALDEPAAPPTTTTIPAVTYKSVLVIGSDEKDPRFQKGKFADAVMLYLVPDDGSGPLIVSLPRDLIVVNPCTGEETKLDRTLEGCGESIGGSELVALAVEDFSGIPVDHFALLRFDALVAMVDSVGGVEICVDNALRQVTRDLLPAGCSTVDGTQALAWIRSRQTQEFVDGEWRFVQNVGDATRVVRQQQLLFALLAELKSIRSPADLASLAGELGDTIVLSDSLGIGDAVAMAWDMRSLGKSSIRTVTVPTQPEVLADGSFALRATASFAETIAG